VIVLEDVQTENSGPALGAAVYTMGQQGPVDDAIARLSALAHKYALYLIAIGGVIGFLGSTIAKNTPFEGMITVAGGVILAAGLLPLMMGALS